MHEMRRIAVKAGGNDRANVLFPYLPVTGEMAAYAAEVKRLTNYEVWRNIESAVFALMPGQESEESGWWNLRVLLDELNWRLSGLEGARTAPNPMSIYCN